MIPKDRIPPEAWQACGEFAVCETDAEFVIAGAVAFGIEGVDRALREVKPSRERLREAANELALVGLKDLAALLRAHARRAKPAPVRPSWDRTINERMRQRMARHTD